MNATLIIELLTCTLLLLGQWRLAGGMIAPVVVLVRLQAVFWFVAYVLRPLYLIAARPVPPDPIADVRLMRTDYSSGLSMVLLVVVLGLASSTAALWMIARRTNHSSTSRATRPQTSLVAHEWVALVILCMLGWLARALYLAGSDMLYPSLGPLATVSSCIGVVYVRKEIFRERCFYVFAVLGEAAWSALFASKTPILAMLAAIGIRWVRDLDPALVRRRLPAICVASIAAFLVIQPLKGVDTASAVSTYSDSGYPVVTGLSVSVLQRADLTKAVTDAYYYRDGPWLGPQEYVEQVVLAVVPKGSIVDFQQAGLRWTREVRAQTNPAQTTDVYLASGVIAEGQVEAGTYGVVLESVALMLLTVAIGRLLGRPRVSLPTVLAAGSFTFDSVLYERGFLGIAESLAKGIQIAVLAWLLLLIMRSARRGYDAETARRSFLLER